MAMTIDEVRAAFNRVEMRHSAIPIRQIRFDANERFGVQIIVELMVASRDDGRSAIVCHRRQFPLVVLQTADHFLFMYKAFLFSIYEHEFQEAYHVDGVRVHDPHQGQPPW